ncbi:T9SS type A sorting domain-containing protein [Xanthomarina sp. GH4-25]|uniref:T9SS type A sorting domain-containing protein n=1 Tax=Xanthomarina sp. GH4-25 TaxID=3349335 RepID=UPI00387805A1
MKKQLLFYVFIMPFLMFSQDYETYGNDVYDPAGVSGDYFGNTSAVSADGSTIVVASILYNGVSGTESQIGKVSVYQKTSDSWTKIGDDIIGYSAGNRFGSSLDINASGDIIAVGTLYGAINGSVSGYVRVFQNISGTWTQLGSDFVGQSANLSLGNAISLNADGTRIAIAASGANVAKGEVKVYQYSTGNWTQLGSAVGGVVDNDRFGTSIDLNDTGDFLAVGAPFVDANGTPEGQNTGQVKVYSYTSDWNQIFVDSGSIKNDILGSNVALSGNSGILVVSATQSLNFDPVNGAGYVKTYYLTGGTYTFYRYILGENSNDRFGSSLALNQDGLFLAVGAPFNDTFGNNLGKTYLYKRNLTSPTNWNIQPGEYDDDAEAGKGTSVGLTANGGVLFTSSNAQDPNSVSGVVKVYADYSTLTVINNLFENELEVYPNPTSDILYINNISKSRIETIKVVDIMGRLCLEKQIHALGKTAIDMSNLSNGSYLIEVLGNNSRRTFKVIKN